MAQFLPKHLDVRKTIAYNSSSVFIEVWRSNRMNDQPNIESKCATCSMREKAEQNPKSFVAWLWRFHTKFCPGWKAYQRELAELEATGQ
jgi:hypothetical protein